MLSHWSSTKEQTPGLYTRHHTKYTLLKGIGNKPSPSSPAIWTPLKQLSCTQMQTLKFSTFVATIVSTVTEAMLRRRCENKTTDLDHSADLANSQRTWKHSSLMPFWNKELTDLCDLERKHSMPYTVSFERKLSCM
jgi:hypothetical protein